MDSRADFEGRANQQSYSVPRDLRGKYGPLKNNGCYRLHDIESNTFSRAFLFALGPPLPALVSGVVILGRDGCTGTERRG